MKIVDNCLQTTLHTSGDNHYNFSVWLPFILTLVRIFSSVYLENPTWKLKMKCMYVYRICKAYGSIEPQVTELGMKLLENYEQADELFRFVRETVSKVSLKVSKNKLISLLMHLL